MEVKGLTESADKDSRTAITNLLKFPMNFQLRVQQTYELCDF